VERMRSSAHLPGKYQFSPKETHDEGCPLETR
jgi:hypothetical protein